MATMTLARRRVPTLPLVAALSNWSTGKTLVAPAVIYAVIVTQLPFVVTVWYSLLRWNLLRPDNIQFAGLDNYLFMYTTMNLPIAIWMLRSFFEEIPRDVIQAAEVDGADVATMITRIILPMITPGLTATMFIGAIFAWNEFFFAVSLTATKAATVPMFMIGFVTSEGLFWAKLAAAGTMAMLPVVIAGWVAQRQLVRGLSLGAVK